ncbi:LuxR C-terminal-related transcriptional regulator [Virgibacillus sp. C22-A2]|uniref:LuxR C-terminal-related transcriptional regulator n=1 Tax=Virgibacillus tibetensis TaxID=3042313 RepID=A0ABU6KDY2_9BACI|nr:LuxR C-terminal-related transcriptional regulator [Virgibacillus sp. C22-A2]
MKYETKRTSTESKSMDAIINETEESFFVGRKEELELFTNWLEQDFQDFKVLHLYGTGGVGNTFLLNAYARIAEKRRVPFLKMDSQDFIHTPAGFSEHVLSLLGTLYIDAVNSSESVEPPNTLTVLNSIAEKGRIIIAIDTYEQMEDLDRWFRNILIRELHPNVVVLLAGRNKLRGEWSDSPTWRTLINQIELKDFTFVQSKYYLKKCGINKEQLIRNIWQFTEGHPLTLTLVTLSKIGSNTSQSSDNLSDNKSQLLIELTERWLKEVKNEETQHLLYVAALFHHFDQTSLSAVLDYDVSFTAFNELITLSFIRTVKNGWAMHDLIRDAIQIELKHRAPEQYNCISKHITDYFYRRTIETRSPNDIAQFFYHLRNDFIQTAFFQNSMNSYMYLEPVGAYNFQEVIAFFEFKKKNLQESEAAFYNRTADKSYYFHASLQHNKKELEFLGPEYIKKIGCHSANLLKNKIMETIGLSIIVPINENTLPYLATEPVSRAYFNQLSDKEIAYFNVPPNENAGWYIRHLDYTDPKDTSAHSFLLYNLFTLLLPGGKIITSSPVTFFQDLLKNLGFEEVLEAISYDFGNDIPSPTYMLDVRGTKLDAYLKQFTENTSVQYKMKIIADTFSFTNKEIEIVKLIMEGCSNLEIASKLFIAEITVKKHVSRILKKANAKNRAQLARTRRSSGNSRHDSYLSA